MPQESVHTPSFSESMAPLTVQDIQGLSQSIPARSAKATVLVFIAHDCPISSSYAPTIQRIAAEYGPRNVAFFLVFAEPDFSAGAAKDYVAQYGYKFPAILENWRELVSRTSVCVTPECVVIKPSGEITYRGRIDDWFADLGVQRQMPTSNDLKDAISKTLLGQPIAQRQTQPVGCCIVKNIP